MKYSATADTPIQMAMRVFDGFPLSSPGPCFGSNGSLTRPCYPPWSDPHPEFDDKVCHRRHPRGMATMNVSLPDSLKEFVESQVAERGYGTSSEFVRELIRREQARARLRELVIDGMGSGEGSVLDDGYFDRLRDRAREAPGHAA